MARLRRSRLDAPGLGRRRCGSGFQYLTEGRQVLRDGATLERIRQLAIPPAWSDVWICPWPNGHIQATGRDAAGRLQYRYHDDWRRRRDAEKFVRVVEFGRALPAIREQVARDLREPRMTRTKVLALAVRLLDHGLFRSGGEEYAEENGSYGLATLRREHVRFRGGEAWFEYPAKSGKERAQRVADPDAVAALRRLKQRRSGGDRLLAWQEAGEWTDLRADDVNSYLKEIGGAEFTAKDFRTWGATVLCAALLAAAAQEGSNTARRRAVTAAIREVAEALGNTPAVCRKSYVDPRVVDSYWGGETIEGALAGVAPGSDLTGPDALTRMEDAVIALLDEAPDK
jgi:DNA topoisomerase-1